MACGIYWLHTHRGTAPSIDGTFDVPQLPVVGGVEDGDTWVYTEVTALDGDGSDYAVNVILQ
jgi:hypothetical protein